MGDTHMSKTGDNGERSGFLARVWAALWRPSTRYSLAGLVIVGFVGGIVFWGSYNWAMELSNTETFCISCHEMESTVYQELKDTPHYSNPSGVRAVCSDCHVPKEWIHKMLRKARATVNEVPKHLIGTIDTAEKFEAKRLHLATNVWATMRATDSRECRNCHSAKSMSLDDQLRPARKKHTKALETGATCVDCHQGIAHKLPEGWKREWEDRFGELP